MLSIFKLKFCEYPYSILFAYEISFAVNRLTARIFHLKDKIVIPECLMSSSVAMKIKEFSNFFSEAVL